MESAPVHTSSKWIILCLNPFTWRGVQSGNGRVELFSLSKLNIIFLSFHRKGINCCWWVSWSKQTLQTPGSQGAKLRSSSKGIAKHLAPAARLLWEKLWMKMAKIKLNGLSLDLIWNPILSTSIFQAVFSCWSCLYFLCLLYSMQCILIVSNS